MKSRQLEKKKQKNVIILWNYLNWGGAQIYLLSIVKHAPENWKFKIVVPRKSPNNIVELFKLHGAVVEYQDVFLDTNQAFSLYQKLKRQWRRIHSEFVTYQFVRRQELTDSVLHIETAPWQSWFFLKKLTTKVNVFMTMHNALPNVSILRQIIWKARLKYISKQKHLHLFTSNQDTKNSLKGWVTDDFWNRIKVTYTCIDPPEIEGVLNRNMPKKEIRKRYCVENNKFVVLCVGQFIDRKGTKVFLDAARKLLPIYTDLQFLWLTQSAINEEDKELIASYELSDSFRLVKSESVGKKREDILQFFLIADIFALPSFVEGLPIALLEAMALGIPSISTNVNAVPEAVINEKTGLLIEAGSSEQLAEAIKKLKSDANLRNEISKTGKDFVMKNFDERVCAKIVLNNYEKALRDR
ncbi:MAG: glycosyltransferase family 4 protein [Pyrinomonadaceae bacterium]